MTDDQLDDTIAMFKSLSLAHRDSDRAVLGELLKCDLLVDQFRYGDFRGSVRGAVKSLTGEKFYFQITAQNPMRLLKAEEADKVAEVDRILKSAPLGGDLIRAIEGSGAELPPPAEKEPQAVAEDQQDVEDVHPGGTVAMTPESDASVERWHGAEKSIEAAEMLKSMATHLRRTIPHPVEHLEPLEHRYMREVMGKSLEQIAAGARISPTRRADFARWSARQVRGHVNALEQWVRDRE